LGWYQYLRLPSSVTHAGDAYWWQTSEIFDDLPNWWRTVEDAIVYSTTFEEFVGAMLALFCRAATHNVAISTNVCSWQFRQFMSFLSHLIVTFSGYVA
jgi:hypothetical protein